MPFNDDNCRQKQYKKSISKSRCSSQALFIMAKQKSHQFLTLVFGGELLLTTLLLTPFQAQSIAATAVKPIPSRTLISQTFEPPGSGKPDDTAGGASRGGGQCPDATGATSPTNMRLKPVIQSGLTVAERPTFFVYVPPTSAEKALFVLKDETEDYFYQKTISIPRTAGIVSVKLPEDAPAIKIGKTYQWSLIMMCGQAIKPDSPTVQGQIQRVEPNAELMRQLNQSSPQERAALYWKNGILYDTLSCLAEQRQAQPNDSSLVALWEKLLKSVGLEAIATKPLLQ